MKMKAAWTLLLLSLIIRVGSAAPMPLRNATAAEMKTFIRLYREGDDASLRRDIAYSRRKLTTDFTARWSSGKTVHRAESLQSEASFYRQVIKFNASTSKIESLRFHGKQAFAVVTGTDDLMARAQDKKVHRFYYVTRSTQTWILTKQGWKCQASTTLSEHLWMDGHFAR